MQPKTQPRQSPSKFESKTRRAASHNRDLKKDRAKSREYQQDVMELFGYK